MNSKKSSQCCTLHASLKKRSLASRSSYFGIFCVVFVFSTSVTAFCRYENKHKSISFTLHASPPFNQRSDRLGTSSLYNSFIQNSPRDLNQDLTFHPPGNNIKKIPILFENDHMLVINKPEGIAHHDDTTSTPTVPGILTVLRQIYPDKGRLYGIHRLDKVTSGILIFAKSSQVAGILSKSFRERRGVKKFYLALSAKKPIKKKMGWVRGNMIRGRRSSWMLTRQSALKGADAKESDNWAVTRFYTKGLGDLFLNGNSSSPDSITTSKTLLLLQPLTGKTHQLRVASKSVGLPILGDATYGGGSGADHATKRTYLHATAMSLSYELNGKEEEVNVFCMPNFFPDFCDGDNYDLQRGLENEVINIFIKHCDSASILKVVNKEKKILDER